MARLRIKSSEIDELGVGVDHGRITIRLAPWTKYAALALVTLITAGLAVFLVTDRPGEPAGVQAADRPAVTEPSQSNTEFVPLPMGPLGLALQDEIAKALEATGWPALEPSMESVINEGHLQSPAARCGQPEYPNQSLCTWGSPSAARKVVVVGDSVATTYADLLQGVAQASPEKLRVRSEAMFDCPFIDVQTAAEDEAVETACPGRKQHAIDAINELQPDVVIISNSYARTHVVDRGEMTPLDWKNSLRREVDRIRGNTRKIVFLAPPPADVTIANCYAGKYSRPADCVSTVTNRWRSMAAVEQQVAAAVGGIWIDSRPWFCNQGRRCPSFVGLTPTKYDWALMTPAYARKITPVVDEAFHAAGIFEE